MIAYGVAAHEGHLFGSANQVLNLIVAIALLISSIAASVLWLRRRPPGRLGLPPRPEDRRSGIVVCILAVLLGLLLPEFGAGLTILVVGAAYLRIREGRRAV